jgi:hypothetical protein
MNTPQQAALYASAHDARLTFGDLVNAGFMEGDIYLIAHDTPGIHADQLFRLNALGGGEGLPGRPGAGIVPISALYDSLIRIGVDLIASAEGWRERGWEGWNPHLEPLDRKAIDRERDFLGLEKPGT